MPSSRPIDNGRHNNSESQRRYPQNPSQLSQSRHDRIRDDSDDEFDNLNALDNGGRGKRDKKMSRKVAEANEHGQFIHPLRSKRYLQFCSRVHA